ncbi:MAG TPA: hypothetical protein VKH42_17185 [Vicinamibacterales bacterium]|nr:hypothetical protein [Vicinamibacterales bacterium]
MRRDVPLAWERVLWRARPLSPVLRARGEKYVLTDLRLVVVDRRRALELALGDIGEVARSASAIEGAFGVSTLVVSSRRAQEAPLVLAGIRRATQFAALLELLSGDPHAAADPDSLRRALAWTPRAPAGDFRGALVSIVAMPVTIAAAAAILSLPGHATPFPNTSGDAIAPNGARKSRAEIVAFMQREVMPWARATFGPLKGGPDRVACETCHGPHADAHDWAMPAVPALPRMDLPKSGWEIYNRGLDAQIRNAIYGYAADSGRQPRAAYMREMVVPGMARLLHREPYDFTRPYEYNRDRHALGCYHCHRVS